MIVPAAKASATAVNNAAAIATTIDRLRTSHPTIEPTTTAGTHSTHHNMPAIGQVFEFIANGTMKQTHSGSADPRWSSKRHLKAAA